MTEKKLIKVLLEGGDRFTYGGEKNMDELLDFIRWKTPTNIKCVDINGFNHIFHSSKILHIYEEVVFVPEEN